MPVRGADHRHPVLPGRRQPGASREAVRRSRGRPRDPHVPAPRSGPRLQLRVQALRDPRVARAVRAVQSALPRSLPARPLPSRVRAAHGRLVRAEASGRGLRRDVRGVAHAPLAVAAALPGLARHGQAALRRSRGAQGRRHRARRAAGLHRHHGGRDEHDRGGVLPRPGARGAARRRRPRARSHRSLRPPPQGPAAGGGIRARAPRRPHQQDRVLDRGAPQRRARARRSHGGDQRAPPPRRARRHGGGHARRADHVRDHAHHELPHPRQLRAPRAPHLAHADTPGRRPADEDRRRARRRRIRRSAQGPAAGAQDRRAGGRARPARAPATRCRASRSTAPPSACARSRS